jgi:hypothetical protein
MSKKIKRFIKRSAPVALPLLLGALSKKDVKLPPNPKMDAAVKGAQDALAENQRQIDMFNTPEAVREITRDPRMINTNMRRIAELRRRGPIMRTVPMETMQEGGIVEAAQDIADKGRNGDSMLVHMAPEEVQGIAALGGVSINPETGLPEMFKFKDFLKIAVPIALTAMAPGVGAAAAAKGTAAANAATAAGTAPGFFAKAGQFLGTGIGKSLLTGAAQFAGQRLVGTDEKDALNAGIMAGATYGAASAAQKAFGPSQAQQDVMNARRQAETARQQQFINQMSPDQVNLSRPEVFQSDAFGTAGTTAAQRPTDIASVIEQYPELSKNYGLREGMSQAELDAAKNLAQYELRAMQTPTDKFAIPGTGGKNYSDVGPTRPTEPLYIDKSDLYSGLGAAAVGAMSVPPEVIEEEERKRKEIEMARPYSDPVTYPGAGYGSREYGYFGPNYGMYAKEGGHIKQMQEGGAVDTPVSAFSGDLMSFAPVIASGANYGMGAMPDGIDSSEFNYNVAPNMGGYDYRSFVPASMQGQGIASVGTGMGTGEQVTGDPNIVQRGMAEDVAKKARKEAAKKPGEPKIIRFKRVPLHGHAGVAPSYKLVPVYGYEEGGAVDTTTGADIPVSAFSGDLMSFAPVIASGANYGMGAMPGGMDSVEYNYGVAPNMGRYDYRSFVPEDARGQGITSVGAGMGTGEQVTGSPNVIADTKKASGSRSTSTFKPYTKWTSISKLGMKVDPRFNKMFRDVVSGYTASGEPIYTRETRREVPAYDPYKDSSGKGRFRYGTMPIKFQEGGITSLPQTEGQVEGNGDGMSDEVYGDIENQQEVALSKDEFIVPADVVSSLGNGSSDAGADELYRMMERVRMAKSGKKTQPPEIDAEDYLPA